MPVYGMFASLVKLRYMNDVNFKPLFDYLDEKFTKIDKQFDEVRDNVNSLQTSVDKLVGQVLSFQ